MTTAHISEVINIIETGLSLEKSLGFLAWVITKDNIQVYPVAIEQYEKAMPIAEENKISVNDALAYAIMQIHGLTEIYSFDRHFNQLRGIIRLPSI